MAENQYAIVGSWFYRPGPKGISLLKYHPEDGSLKLLITKFRWVNADGMYLDRERKTAYFADACATPKGGRAVAVKIDKEAGDLELVSKKETLFRDPDYICMDGETKQYAFVSHHSNTVLVNKFIRREDGSFDTEALYDDVGLVVFRVKGDGSLGEICDVALTSTDEMRNGEHAYSRQHSVVMDPKGKFLAVCDKGLDQIDIFSFDREKEKLRLLGECRLASETGPRYGVFHPSLPYFYCSCEKRLVVLAFRYDADTGEMVQVSEVKLADEQPEFHHPKNRIESGDIKLNAAKGCLYVTVRGLNQIVVLKIGEDGFLQVKQTVSCGGENPRCLCLAPDGRYLLCGNLESQKIRTLEILADGTLALTDRETEVPLPSCIGIL